MVDSTLWNESTLWAVAWQTTLVLAFGILAGLMWSHRPARAHRLLVMAIIGSLFVPALTLAVRKLDCGLLVRSGSEETMAIPPLEAAATRISTAAAPDGVDPVSGEALAAGASLGRDQETPAASAEPLTDSPLKPTPFEVAPLAAPSEVEEKREQVVSEARLSPVAWLAWAWMVLSGAMALRLVRLLRRARVFVAGRRPAESPVLRQALNEAASRLDLQTSPELCVTSVGCPVVWCWGRRPVVFVGPDIAERLLPRDWVAVFCHELAHWMRGDHLAAAISEILVVLLPWNPLAWWAKGRLSQLAERACDDWVLGCGHVATAYAESLVTLSQRQSLSPGMARAAKNVPAAS